MCGFVGYHLGNGNAGSISAETLRKMAFQMHHRGPDNTGILENPTWGMAHNRLSIIDLHVGANQPMSKHRLYMAYNGEVYNFPELKKELEELGHTFQTQSDTEVVLTAYFQWREEAFKRLNGIFAISIYDEEKQELILCRDRLGIKPLYVYHKDQVLLFGSEIKAFIPSGLMDKTLNPQAIVEFMWMNSPAGEETVYRHVSKLKPGTFMKVRNDGSMQSFEYYSPENISKIRISDEEAIRQTAVLLENAVKRQSISDVPLCIFLSGGVDSSALTLLAARHSEKRLNTFSVEFDFYKKGGSELPNASLVAKQAGSDHHELYIDSSNLSEVVNKLAFHHDEPFADSANIPLYLLTKQIEGKYRVVLQGDGGDELFGGYYYYNYLQRGSKYIGLAKLVYPLLSGLSFSSPKLRRYKRAISYLAAGDRAQLVGSLVFGGSYANNPTRVFNPEMIAGAHGADAFDKLRKFKSYKNEKDLLEYLNYFDMLSVLPNDFLEKVDKSTMANSVEARVPFLDNELVDFAMSLPINQRVRQGSMKYLLKKAMEGTVPDQILYGKKQGFGVPFEEWLKTGLNSYFYEVVNDRSIQQAGIFNTDEVLKLMKEHESGRVNNGNILWHVLNFSLWYHHFMIES